MCGAGDGRPCCSRVIPILEVQSPQLASFPDSSWNFDFSVCFFPPTKCLFFIFFSFGGESFRFCRISLFMILRNQKLLVSWKREEFCSGNAQVVGTLGIAPTLLVGDTL